MRYVILFVLCLFSQPIFSRNLKHVAFDTNGEVGECLFPENEDGEIIFSEIINCKYGADTIFGYANEWIYDMKHKYNLDINDRLDGITKIAFEVEMPIGKDIVDIDDLVIFERHKSQVTFRCVIEIKDNKYRYTLCDFYTNRRNIRGDGKSEGPSNLLHWQRVNSLTKEKAKQEQIDSEIEMYKAEYNGVCAFIEGLRNFTNITLDF